MTSPTTPKLTRNIPSRAREQAVFDLFSTLLRATVGTAIASLVLRRQLMDPTTAIWFFFIAVYFTTIDVSLMVLWRFLVSHFGQHPRQPRLGDI